jgi:group I intron endonuclease
MTSIIYVATNQITGKKYVGQTTKTLEKRMNQHLVAANNGSTTKFHQALRQYGFENFIWDEVPCFLGDLNTSEKYLIKQYNTIEEGYNTAYQDGMKYPVLSFRIRPDKYEAIKQYVVDNNTTISDLFNNYVDNLIERPL